MNTGIYAITNTENNKVYIGRASNFKKRWASHKSLLRCGEHTNQHLQCAWSKYGEKSFKFEILEYLDSQEELHLAEQFWVDIYREEGRVLYNYGLVAKSHMLGRKHSKESRRKMSESHIGHSTSEETRRKISNAAKGRVLSGETCCKISRANRGNTSALGCKHNEESRRKVANANARSYPMFVHRETGEIIPAGYNLNKMCRERELIHGSMWRVMVGKQKQHRDWMLQQERK